MLAFLSQQLAETRQKISKDTQNSITPSTNRVSSTFMQQSTQQQQNSHSFQEPKNIHRDRPYYRPQNKHQQIIKNSNHECVL